jgi:hypothetical protein
MFPQLNKNLHDIIIRHACKTTNAHRWTLPGGSLIVSTMNVFDNERPIRKLIPKRVDHFVFVVVFIKQ